MKYTIIFSNEGMNDLIEKINANISEGWKPIGGISVTPFTFIELNNEKILIYMQAMIKD